MPKKIDPRLAEILTAYGESANPGAGAIWDCHGVWVIYHAAIERIAARAGVKFTPPTIVEADTQAKTVAIIVSGEMGDRSEWSFGEASPANNKNAYIYAMAEKRAKDRVVLKLVGLHGLAYSEEESDSFKVNRSEPKEDAAYSHEGLEHQLGDPPAKSSAQLKRDDAFGEFERELWECDTLVMLDKFKAIWREKIRHDGWPTAWKHAAKDLIEGREKDIMEAMDAAELAELPLKEALKHSVQRPL